MGILRDLLNWRSLRWKIAALVAVSCCAIALTVGVLVHRSTLARSMNDGRLKAVTQLSRDLQDHERDDAARPGPLSSDAVPEELLHRLRSPQGLKDGYATWYDGEAPGDHPSMWAARMYRGVPVAVEVDMTPDLLTRRALDRHMWKYSLVALAVVVPLSALAAELPNRRLRRVARTARRIAAGDLAARTAAGRGSDEIAEISATVDSMADSLLGRLLAEQRFTADVAHELRTPLMGLVTASELLPEAEATELVRDRVVVLRTLVENLLEISRLDAGVERAEVGPVPLADAIRESLARTGLRTRLTTDDVLPAVTDPRRLDRIVANLVANAHRHGRDPVEVEVAGTCVTVRDHGPGFPRELLTDGPQRFRTGASERGRGQGLGLTIALGQAHVIGASLSFANASDGGAVATLRLPAAG
ncbi:HAMP domain-containing sensor histidine kinase [Streptomyces sp. NE06-03E]|uniref:histidine kinase n=1 Tax=Streptomyces silvae TaxID=2803812 RepID=A0ABU8A3S2_9ACTN|nr:MULTISPECIES: HAMP domain-containing sensor histidine kinase [unclassified Streptomyces]WSS62969.1 HAMP domain-containing histidine kinase [Streptomyces sp. NBC_01177]WSS69984.1 HAMP domain-containing histidine kinase [Streptomyces sp. NBC_01175]MDX3055678.1 HAMP domain-containing sensor histidine kinase [Streptomyces sp. NE06-03E]MDX3323570.1 HAMP domain-containing sensor histidine kinase [Streptomyces sp. ME02-6979-3A]MDX3686677.1 HAMP domain-containing sensor histidine kinase [Streptomyc